jgi:hypothetical protein
MNKEGLSSLRLSSKSTKRLIAARTNGSYGGQERALRYEQVILSEWGSRGGKAVLAKYGPEYFKELRKRRKKLSQVQRIARDSAKPALDGWQTKWSPGRDAPCGILQP